MKKILFLAIAIFAVFGIMTVNNSEAALQTDILIKASDRAVYYYAEDGRRYVFPTEKTYKTWFENYDNVNTISDEALSQIPLGGNVVYRAGSKLIKILTDPRVYVVSPNGYLHWMTSEALAIKLYGADWADLVDDVPDAFFTNYKYGDDLDSETYVDGTLITYGDGGNTYVIEDGKKVQLRYENTLTANYFNSNFIRTCSADILFESNGSMFASKTRYRDVAQIMTFAQGRLNGSGQEVNEEIVE